MMDQETERPAFEPITLDGEDLAEYQELGLPTSPPEIFYQALARQLDRLPLLELQDTDDVVAA